MRHAHVGVAILSRLAISILTANSGSRVLCCVRRSEGDGGWARKSNTPNVHRVAMIVLRRYIQLLDIRRDNVFMTSIGALEAKTRLSELLDRVARGEEIMITRDGKPAARLVPAEAKDFTAIAGKKRIDLDQLRAIAEAFKAQVKGPFSSGDINNILYDEDGLPK